MPARATIADLIARACGPAPECWSAFAALAETGDVTALHALVDFLHAPDCYVRRAALEAIGNHIHGRTAAELIIPCLRDSSEFVVRTACEVAVRLGLHEAHDDVVKLLSSPLESTRQAALCALETLGQDEDFDIVLRMFEADRSYEFGRGRPGISVRQRRRGTGAACSLSGTPTNNRAIASGPANWLRSSAVKMYFRSLFYSRAMRMAMSGKPRYWRKNEFRREGVFEANRRSPD